MTARARHGLLHRKMRPEDAICSNGIDAVSSEWINQDTDVDGGHDGASMQVCRGATAGSR